ncbi:MAG: flagellar hook-length control protein FliK [Candidatus Riflebacteria bacterium]|nr:flagellar hook-length control protein FliK [Candidatus Riflebacteria bacterium]
MNNQVNSQIQNDLSGFFAVQSKGLSGNSSSGQSGSAFASFFKTFISAQNTTDDSTKAKVASMQRFSAIQPAQISLFQKSISNQRPVSEVKQYSEKKSDSLNSDLKTFKEKIASQINASRKNSPRSSVVKAFSNNDKTESLKKDDVQSAESKDSAQKSGVRKDIQLQEKVSDNKQAEKSPESENNQTDENKIVKSSEELNSSGSSINSGNSVSSSENQSDENLEDPESKNAKESPDTVTEDEKVIFSLLKDEVISSNTDEDYFGAENLYEKLITDIDNEKLKLELEKIKTMLPDMNLDNSEKLSILTRLTLDENVAKTEKTVSDALKSVAKNLSENSEKSNSGKLFKSELTVKEVKSSDSEEVKTQKVPAELTESAISKVPDESSEKKVVSVDTKQQDSVDVEASLKKVSAESEMVSKNRTISSDEKVVKELDSIADTSIENKAKTENSQSDLEKNLQNLQKENSAESNSDKINLSELKLNSAENNRNDKRDENAKTDATGKQISEVNSESSDESSSKKITSEVTFNDESGNQQPKLSKSERHQEKVSSEHLNQVNLSANTDQVKANQTSSVTLGLFQGELANTESEISSELTQKESSSQVKSEKSAIENSLKNTKIQFEGKPSDLKNGPNNQNESSNGQGNMNSQTSSLNALGAKPSEGGDTVRSAIMNQMIEKIQMVQDLQNVKTLTVNLRPEILGKVDIHLTSRDGIVNARIVAESAMVKEHLEALVPQIKNTLTDQGINLNNISVDVFAKPSDGRNKGSFSKNPNKEPRLSGIGGTKLARNILKTDELESGQENELEKTGQTKKGIDLKI